MCVQISGHSLLNNHLPNWYSSLPFFRYVEYDKVNRDICRKYNLKNIIIIIDVTFIGKDVVY